MGGDLRDGRSDAVVGPAYRPLSPDAAPPAPGTVLCQLADIADPGGREFSFGRPPHEFTMFVIRRGSQAFGYVNDCPHARSPLNWLPDKFLDPSRTLIQCATHGARFRIEDGFCVGGPCPGKSLLAVPVRVEGGAVVVTAGYAGRIT